MIFVTNDDVSPLDFSVIPSRFLSICSAGIGRDSSLLVGDISFESEGNGSSSEIDGRCCISAESSFENTRATGGVDSGPCQQGGADGAELSENLREETEELEESNRVLKSERKD